MPKPQMINTKETAKRLNITRDAVIKQVARGQLDPMFKAPGLTGSFFFDPRVIDRIAATKDHNTTSQ